MFNFQILHRERQTAARTGIITTSHGPVHTPAFVPLATQASVKALTPQQVEDIGFESVMANTYHLYFQPGVETVQQLGGLHQFMNWNKPLWTDSGGFQIFSLPKKYCKVTDEGVLFRSPARPDFHLLTPERAIAIQQQLGADIIFTFDECIAHDSDYRQAKEALQRTHQWAKRCVKEFHKNNRDQALYGIIQGGKFSDLRTASAQFISTLPVDGFGLGSLFGEPKEETKQIAQVMMKALPEEKPKHFLGIGSIDDFFMYVEMGGDTFDCVLPTRLGRQGYVFLRPESGGTVQNKFRMRITHSCWKNDPTPIDQQCSCYVCKNFSRAYIYHLGTAKELLFYTLTTYHNLFYFQRLFAEIRQAIETDQWKELKRKWVGGE